jgi:hypothetical protein
MSMKSWKSHNSLLNVVLYDKPEIRETHANNEAM